jgi:hypothetical protein
MVFTHVAFSQEQLVLTAPVNAKRLLQAQDVDKMPASLVAFEKPMRTKPPLLSNTAEDSDRAAEEIKAGKRTCSVLLPNQQYST